MVKPKVAVSFAGTYDDYMPIEHLVLLYKQSLATIAHLNIKLDRLMRAESKFNLRGKQNYRLKYEQLSIRHNDLLADYAKAISLISHDKKR